MKNQLEDKTNKLKTYESEVDSYNNNLWMNGGLLQSNLELLTEQNEERVFMVKNTIQAFLFSLLDT